MSRRRVIESSAHANLDKKFTHTVFNISDRNSMRGAISVCLLFGHHSDLFVVLIYNNYLIH